MKETLQRCRTELIEAFVIHLKNAQRHIFANAHCPVDRPPPHKPRQVGGNPLHSFIVLPLPFHENFQNALSVFHAARSFRHRIHDTCRHGGGTNGHHSLGRARLRETHRAVVCVPETLHPENCSVQESICFRCSPLQSQEMLGRPRVPHLQCCRIHPQLLRRPL